MPTSPHQLSWVPLPPRVASGRTLRGNQTSRPQPPSSNKSLSRASHGDGEKRADGTRVKQARRQNRPGYNSYLKVDVDPHFVGQLHQITIDLQATLQGAMQTTPCGSSAFAIKPRSLPSLHMTFFFGGETLCELPPSELADWYSSVSSILAPVGFAISGEPSPPSTGSSLSCENLELALRAEAGFWFKLKDIRLFPPRRNNLVVAVLEASPAWHTLHAKIRNVAKQSNSEGLRDVLQYSKDKWIAHITLANVATPRNRASSSREQMQLLERMCSNIQVPQMDLVYPQGIAMGGPIPPQQTLDWDFRYKETTH